MLRCLLLAFVAVASLHSALASGRTTWNRSLSDLPQDPRLTVGELENGFGYVLLPHDSKPGIVSMRLLVGLGSLDERESERGLAHFVEHMAFEGTRRFKPGELIEFFQRLGMSYGLDVNAFTYPDKTVYHLELPQNDAELVDKSLMLYRDYADGILFDADRVENERKVILRERLARDTPSARISEAAFAFAFEGTLLPESSPIGLARVVREVSPEQLQAFYERWYRPDLMTLVVVGDIDPAELEQQLKPHFASLERPRRPPPPRKIGRLKRAKPGRAKSMSVEGIERYTLETSRAWMERETADSWTLREKDALRSFATALLNERCRDLIDGMSGDFAHYNRIYGIPFCQLTISSGGEFWWEGFLWMDRLLRQTKVYGFTETELEFMRENWLRSIRSSVRWQESAEPRQIIDDLVESIAEGSVFLDPGHYADKMESIVSSFTLAEVNRAFADTWKHKKMSYFMAGDMETRFDAVALKRHFKEDRKYLLFPYIPQNAEDFEYTLFPERGIATEEALLPEVGARTFRFSNNTRLNLLSTQNENDTVRLMVRAGSGLLAFAGENPATHALAMNALFRSSFGDRDLESVFKELRANVISFSFGVDDHDAFTYRGLTQSDGVDEFLKIVAEYLNDPSIDEDAFEVAQLKLTQNLEHEPDGLSEGYMKLHRMLYPDLPRFHSPTLDEVANADAEAVRQWLLPAMREGYIEVSIVGDFDETTVLEMFADSIGALPERRKVKPPFEEQRALRFLPISGKRRIEYPHGKGEGAASVVTWTVQEPLTLREGAALHLLCAAFESRLRKRVREQMGATYAPSARYVSFPAYDALHHVRVNVDCSQEDADALLDIVLEIAAELSEEAIDADELLEAMAPLQESLKQAWTDNAYLLESVLFAAQEYPEAVRGALRYRDGLVAEISAEEIRDLAARYLAAEDALAVAIVPGAAGEIGESPGWEGNSRLGTVD